MAVKASFDADFGKFISELTKVEVKLRDFEPAADKASARLQRMADSLNGNKLLEQAAVAVNAINRIEGGVAALNNGELRKYGSLIDAATEKLGRMGRDVPPALAQVKAALDQARAPLDAINKSAGETAGAFSGLSGAIGQGLGIGAGISAFDLVAQGVGKLKDEIVQTITEGNRLSQLRTAFESLQGGPGPAAVAMGDLRTATRGLVSDIDLLAAANKASLLGLGQMGIKTEELASIAVRLGKAMGQDAAKSVDDLTTALARQSPQILDNLGIKVDLTAATASYAASLGKSADALTDEEKKMAFATAAMDAARAKANTLGDAQLTLSEQIARVTNALGNMQSGLGATINESAILAGVVGNLGDRLEDLNDTVSGLGGDFVQAFGPLGQIAGSFVKAAGGADLFSQALSMSVAPALSIGTLQLKAYKGVLDSIAAVRMSATGELSDITLPTPGRDRTLLDPTMGQGRRAQEWLSDEQKRLTDEYVKSQEDALRKIEQGEAKAGRKLDQLAQQRTERLNRLTGRDALLAAQQVVKDIDAVGGVSKLSSASMSRTFGQLFEAREIARAIAPNLVAGFSTALGQLATAPAIRNEAREASAKIFRQLVDPNDLRRILATSGTSTLIGRELTQAISPLPDALRPTIADTYELARGLNGIGVPLGAVLDRFEKVTATTKDWRGSLQNVSQAFASLAQITGGLDPLTRTIGTIAAASNAAGQLVDSLSESFKGLGANFKDSKTGQALGGGLAGAFTGYQLGTQTTSRARGALMGAASGAAAGLAFGGVGAGVGVIAGAVGGYFGAAKAASELRKAKDLQMETLVAQYGTLDVLLETVGRLGLSQQTFLERYYGEPKEFAKAVTDLNNALTREKNEAEALAKSLDKVAKAQGVLSRADLNTLNGARPGGPMEEMAEQFRAQQTQSLLGGLDRILAAPGALSASLTKAVGQAFPAALAALEKGGASPIEALKTLMPLLDQFREKAVLAGMGSTPGFDALSAQIALLRDEQLGPLIERASGAGQALGALANLGLLNEETFGGFATSITETVAGMDLLSERGQNAMRLIRQPLQNIWQLQQDFGYEVDASTQALLDQAEAAGLIGDKFRPTEERMLQGIERIADGIERMLGLFTNDMPNAAIAGARASVGSIEEAFGRLRPIVRVRYEEGDLPGERVTMPDVPPTWTPPTGPAAPETLNPGSAGADAARAATTSTTRGAVYMDGRQVGEVVMRHAGDILEFYGA